MATYSMSALPPKADIGWTCCDVLQLALQSRRSELDCPIAAGSHWALSLLPKSPSLLRAIALALASLSCRLPRGLVRTRTSW